MGTGEIIGLGAIAGSTIVLGLPLGRVRSTAPALRACLSAVATGILVFLFWDVTTNGVDPVEQRLEAHHWGSFAWLAFLLALGFTAGLMSLIAYDGWLNRHRGEPVAARPGLSRGKRLAVLIATGIGIHNFGEGLAIGQSAAAGELSLAVVLIVGFGLHNATEGFGIVGPLAGEPELPSWGFLGAMALIGGGPTFLGTVVGQAWVSDALQTLFFALAGGSILYVVIQLFDVCRRFAMPQLVGWMLLLGLALGFGTDFVLTAAGV
jgi:ZIP family zinc transporter